MYTPTQLPAWKALQDHYAEVSQAHLRDLFKDDPKRFERFSLRFEDILLDFSKNRITARTHALLLDLARQAGVPAMAEKMFQGEKINTTEKRAVLHVALRNRSNRPILVDGKDVMTLELKYYQDKPVIERIERVSRPGLRIFKRVDQLPVVQGGLGVAIVSTSQGVMTNVQAKAKGHGGEVLCIVL